jgi:hypothetical protein
MRAGQTRPALFFFLRLGREPFDFAQGARHFRNGDTRLERIAAVPALPPEPEEGRKSMAEARTKRKPMLLLRLSGLFLLRTTARALI